MLGWSPKDNREKIDVDEVVKLFELEKINRRNAAFDLDKCYWLNGQYIAQMSLERFIELARPFLERAGIIPRVGRDSVEPANAAVHGSAERRPTEVDEKYLRAVLAIVKEKIKLLKDGPDWTSYFFTEDFEYDSAGIEKVFGKPEASQRLKALRDKFASLPNWDLANIELAL